MDFLSKVKGLFDSTSLPRKSQKMILPSLLCCNKDPKTRWKKIRELGGGSEARVYQVKLLNQCDQENNQFSSCEQTIAAAKIIDAQDIDQLPEMLAEVKLLSNCQHANVIRVLECYFFDRHIWIIEELCELGAMDSIIFRLGRGLNLVELKCIVRQALSALQYLHDTAHIIHRDVKAANLMLNLNGVLKIGDFGVACIVEAEQKVRTTFIGSSYWMSPEVIVCETDRSKGYSFATDIWSLGITIIELAEMNPPHHTMGQNRVLIRILKHDPPALRDTSNPDLSDMLKKILHKEPELRYTAAQLLQHKWLKEEMNDESECLRNLVALSPYRGNEVSSEQNTPAETKFQHPTQYWKSPQEEKKASSRSEWAESDSTDDSEKNEHITLPTNDTFNGFEGAVECVTVESSPVDVYDVDVSEFRSVERTSSPPPSSHPIAYVIERTTFSSRSKVPDETLLNSLSSSLLCEIIEQVICGSSGGSFSIPDAIFCVISELADFKSDSIQSNSPNISSYNDDCRLSLHNVVQIGRDSSPMARREEIRNHRKQFQLQSQRLNQLKVKQTNEIKSHDNYVQNSRKNLINRLNNAANQMHQEQRQEMQRAENEASNELKLECKRKKNELSRNQKHFLSNFQVSSSVSMHNDQIVNDYMDNLKAYHMARLANLDTSFTKKRHQLKRDQLEEIFAFDERNLCEKFRLLAGHVKHYYAFLRECMLANQQKELEEIDEMNKIERQYLVDELNSQHRSYIKYMKQVKRSRERQFRQNIESDEKTYPPYYWPQTTSISSSSSTHVRSKQLKDFMDNENLKIQVELRRREEYMRQKLDQVFTAHQEKKAQLQCQQAEKRAKCVNKEAQKLAQIQIIYQHQLHDLQHFHEIERNKLEDELIDEIRNKEAFYRSTVEALSPPKPTLIKVGIPQQNNRQNMDTPRIEKSQQF